MSTKQSQNKIKNIMRSDDDNADNGLFKLSSTEIAFVKNQYKELSRFKNIYKHYYSQYLEKDIRLINTMSFEFFMSFIKNIQITLFNETTITDALYYIILFINKSVFLTKKEQKQLYSLILHYSEINFFPLEIMLCLENPEIIDDCFWLDAIDAFPPTIYLDNYYKLPRNVLKTMIEVVLQVFNKNYGKLSKKEIDLLEFRAVGYSEILDIIINNSPRLILKIVSILKEINATGKEFERLFSCHEDFRFYVYSTEELEYLLENIPSDKIKKFIFSRINCNYLQQQYASILSEKFILDHVNDINFAPNSAFRKRVYQSPELELYKNLEK